MRNPLQGWLSVLLACATACASVDPYTSSPTLHYVGSSTVANFIRDAEPVYGHMRFVLDTAPESAGGERAILEGRCDLAGVAGPPHRETLARGVVATLLGKDAIALLVHPENPVQNLSRAQLRSVFTGEVTNWKDLGGADLPIHALLVGPGSATRNVFRAAVLGEMSFSGVQTVRPDSALIDRVRADPAAIAPLSLSFLPAGSSVKRIAVDGEEPLPTNENYSITRPLYLLSWPGRGRVSEFISWTRSKEAESVLLRRFAKAANDTAPGETRSR